MATELATAYVTLVPSLKGAQKRIEAELSGMNFSNAGKTIGGSIASGVKKSGSLISGLGDALIGSFGKVAKVGVGAIAGIGTAVGALAVKGGLTRALNLEQAQTMFKGLKLDWNDYYDTIDKAVTGTAFSLDQGALVAANLAASGIAAGKDMDQALNACVGTAATFGADLGDIGGIFQKVAAQGKLSGENLLQLSSRGINAIDVLSKHLGLTREEVSSMVSSGKIDFKTFSDAMYEAFGESAQAANQTFTGSMQNMRSALNRIGEKFMTPFKDNAIPVFNAVREALNAIGKAIQPLADKFSRLSTMISAKLVSSIRAFTTYFEATGDIAESVKAAINSAFGAGVYDRIMAVVSAIGTLVALGSTLKAFGTGMEIAGKAIGKITTISKKASDAISGLNSALGKALEKASNTFKSKFNIGSAVSGESSKLTAALGKVKGALGTVGSPLLGIAGGSMAVAGGLMAAGVAAAASGVDIQGMADNLLDYMQSMSNTLPMMASELADKLPGVIDSVVSAMPALIDAFATSLMSIVQVFPRVLPSLVQGLSAMVSSLIPLLVQMAPMLLEAGLQLFTSLVQALSEIIPQIIAVLPDLITNLVTVLMANMPLLLEAGLQLFMGLVTALLEVAPQIIDKLPTIIESLVDTLIAFAPQLLSAAGLLFMAIVQAVPKILTSLLAAIGSLLSQIPGKITAFAGNMANAAKEMVMGMIRGIQDAAGAVWDKITEVCSGALDAVKGFFGIASPSKLMRKMFGYVGAGMTLGLRDSVKPVVSAMSSLVEDAAEAAAMEAPVVPLAFEAVRPEMSTASARLSASSQSQSDIASAQAIERLGAQMASRENTQVTVIAEAAARLEMILQAIYEVIPEGESDWDFNRRARRAMYGQA